MSTDTGRQRGPRPRPSSTAGSSGEEAGDGWNWLGLRTDGNDAFRLLALTSLLVLTTSYVAVLRYLTNVVGGQTILLPTVVAMIALATLLSPRLHERTAIGVALALALVGYGYYLLATPGGIAVLFTAFDKIVADSISLLTGLSVLRMTAAEIWSLGFAPAPVFLSWYLVARRRYVAGVVVGLGALSILVLTGDAAAFAQRQGINVTLVGALAAVATVGFGELERRRGTLLQADALVITVTAMAVAAPLLTIVPGGAGGPLFLAPGGGSGSTTVEASLTSSPERITLQGSIRLSPKVRFTIRSDSREYWRVGTYDRFTGRTWVRTGQSRPYEAGLLPQPPGETEDVVQSVTVETRVDAMPAAAQPVEVRGDVQAQTVVTEHGGIRARTSFITNDSYVVESAVLDAGATELREAGTDYPERIENTYLRVPATTPDRVGQLAANITAGEDNAYDQARALELWLETNKDYSLDVDRPNGNLADKFLFEMEAGYCTYYATAMVTMLRTQGIPARFVVGYTPGQEVNEDTYVVRGLNSHAWVEVYVPDQGWVRFDPTPGGPRVQAESQRLRDARSSGVANVDTEESESEPLTTSNESTPQSQAEAIDFVNESLTTQPGVQNVEDLPGRGNLNGSGGTDGPGGTTTLPPGLAGGTGTANATGGGWVPRAPTRGELALGLIALIGLAAGAHRSGRTDEWYDSLRLYWHGARSTPTADVERAYERLEGLLERRYRPRKPGETPRQYHESLSLAGLDRRADRVADLYERARYGDGVIPEEADEAVELVDDLVRERLPVVGRLYRGGG